VGTIKKEKEKGIRLIGKSKSLEKKHQNNKNTEEGMKKADLNQRNER